MRRIIYLCPAESTPYGGIKVIYRHAELLSELGAEAFVLHPSDTNFRCEWFEHHCRFLDSLTLDARADFVVIPELWAGVYGPQCLQLGVRYAMFVQNGYMTHPVQQQDPAMLLKVYRSADLVLVISDDTARMVALNYPGLDAARLLKVQYSVHQRFLSAGASRAGDRTITFMPRKMADHAERVAFALRQHLPADWQIVPIDNVNEATCANMMLSSRIFLSLSTFEGLPVPPVEAALAGNIVIGYTGQGGSEYWERPNFFEIHQGNIIGFVAAALLAAEQIVSGVLQWQTLQPGIARLAERFSAESERAGLRRVTEQIDECFARGPGPTTY